MIMEKNVKLKELKIKLLQKNYSDQVGKKAIETKLAAIEDLIQEIQVKLFSLSQQVTLGPNKN